MRVCLVRLIRLPFLFFVLLPSAPSPSFPSTHVWLRRPYPCAKRAAWSKAQSKPAPQPAGALRGAVWPVADSGSPPSSTAGDHLGAMVRARFAIKQHPKLTRGRPSQLRLLPSREASSGGEGVGGPADPLPSQYQSDSRSMRGMVVALLVVNTICAVTDVCQSQSHPSLLRPF